MYLALSLHASKPDSPEPRWIWDSPQTRARYRLRGVYLALRYMRVSQTPQSGGVTGPTEQIATPRVQRQEKGTTHTESHTGDTFKIQASLHLPSNFFKFEESLFLWQRGVSGTIAICESARLPGAPKTQGLTTKGTLQAAGGVSGTPLYAGKPDSP